MTNDRIFDDLADEYARLDTILGALDDGDWVRPSGVPGWTITDVVAHLALTEEGVSHTLAHICEPLGVALPDTARLAHIAWLGHATLPYAFASVGHDPQPVRAELVGPSGDAWVYGPSDAPSVISGSAAAFCRVGAQRLRPDDSGLTTSGPHGKAALAVLRNYAA